jgi:UDP-hydrolysing UDP-N-acetyl-D-glucosamine 2-epimerase
MRTTLRAIEDHPRLALQLIVTGMHLDRSRGASIREIRREGWRIDATVPWPASDSQTATTATTVATGRATAAIAGALAKLKTDVVLVTGDRVEAFAAASAGHLSGRLVAHVHGGDRALGLVDDSLRHAISKLAHVHFPATVQSAERLAKLGEDAWRIFRVGSPGLDDVRSIAAPRAEVERAFPGLLHRRFALLVLHPQSAHDAAEHRLARTLIDAVRSAGFPRTIIVYPNNDPGSAGIVRAWNALEGKAGIHLHRNLPRGLFLGLMRDAAALIGNSSSGIIEAASFGTPVLDVGTRQSGRERGSNVLHVPATTSALRQALASLWNNGHPPRFAARNLYGSGNAGAPIANTLARIVPERFRQKLIAY